MRLKFWVGQSTTGTNFYVYTTEDETLLLSEFLIKTQGKPLIFVSDHCEEEWFYECEEYRGRDYEN